jgi:hypothetical protein
MIGQQFFYTPTMIRKPCCHRWRSPKPFVASYQTRQPQALVLTTEVVDCSHKVHRLMKPLRQSNQCACSTPQTTQLLTKCGIEPFDERSVEYSSLLRFMAHKFDFLLAALHYSSFDFHQPTRFYSLDDLSDQYSGPSHHPRSPHLTRSLRLTKHFSDRAHIMHKTIGAKQKS